MANMPYDHIEAKVPIYLNSNLAFSPGDPVPLETAQRVGLDFEPADVIKGLGYSGASFVDAAIHVSDPPAPPPPGTEPSEQSDPPDTPPTGAVPGDAPPPPDQPSPTTTETPTAPDAPADLAVTSRKGR